jgi:hypothetical protein
VQASNLHTDLFWFVFSTQLCIRTCRIGSSLVARCLFAWRSYWCIYGDIIAGLRAVNGDRDAVSSVGRLLKSDFRSNFHFPFIPREYFRPFYFLLRLGV